MRKLLALLLLAAALAAGLALWTAHQGARLPGWYLEARAAGTLETDLETVARRSQQALVTRFGRELLDEVTADDGTPDESFLDRVKRRGKMVLEGLREGREVRLDARDLEGLVLLSLQEDRAGRELLAATQAVHAEISEGELELGVVVRRDDLRLESLSEAQLQAIALLLRLAASDGDVYVSLRAVPRAVDELLVLGPPVDLRLGELTLGSALLSALGVEVPELADGVVLDIGGAKVREARVEDQALVLIVSPDV